MENIFLKLLNMSIAASWIVLAVVILRFALKKAPKALTLIMWATVGIRLVCPFSVESVLSLIPSAQTVPQEIIYSATPTIESGISALNSTVNPIISASLAPTPGDSVNPMQIITAVASYIWIIGIAVMLTYTVISYIGLRRKVRESIPLKDNIRLCDRIDTPFILGMIRPKIYLPSSISEEDAEYVIAHETAHLKRLDHLWKPLGFLLLSVYWFNPVMWAVYILLCHDIETACDEKVIRGAKDDIKKQYSSALISCSVSRKSIAACPLAFGEVGVKARVKNVLSYKKPAFWLVIAGILACAVVAVCFLTDPADMKIYEITEESTGSFENIFDDVTHITVYNGKLSSEMRKAESVSALIDELKEIKLSKNPISDDRSDARDMTNRIELNDGKLLCFSDDYSEFWIYTVVKPTLSYKVLNPSRAKSLIEASASDDGAKYFTEGASGSELEGVYLTVKNVYTATGTGYIDILWVNNSEHEIMYGDGFGLYYIDGDEKIDCMSDDAVFNTIAYGLHSQGAEEHKYSLYHCDVSRSGTYLFETTCSVKDGDEYTNYTVWVEFSFPDGDGVTVNSGSFNERIMSIFALSGAKIYVYDSSPDVIKPMITLSESTGRFCFTYSAYSSYTCIGSYELTDDTLTLRTDDGVNTYVFDAKDDTFIFDASRSSEIPKYKYSWNAKPESPVPDGAVFSSVRSDGTTVDISDYSPIYDTLEFDIDGDGNIEDCLLTRGYTSGLFTFELSVLEDGKLEYHGTYMSEAGDLSFEEDADGKVRLHLALSNSDEVYDYDISVNENGYIIFSRDGEILAFTSKPDLVS